MRKLSLEDLSRQAVIAALYVVATLSLPSAAFGPIQFRYSEILNLLAFYNPINAIGVTLGVFISNFWSTLGAADLIFGTLHTAIALYFVGKSKNLWMASIWPTVFAFIIGFELSVIANIPGGGFLLHTATVMASEFIIMTVIAVPVFKLLQKNDAFLKSIGSYRHYLETNKNL